LVFAAEAARAATVIGDGDNGGQIDDRALGSGILIAATNDMLFQAAEKRGKSGATAKSDNTKAAGEVLFEVRVFHERFKF